MKRFLIKYLILFLLILATIFSFCYYVYDRGIYSKHFELYIKNEKVILNILNYQNENIYLDKINIEFDTVNKYVVLINNLKIENNIINLKTTLDIDKIINYIKTEEIDLDLENVSYQFHKDIPPVKTLKAKLEKKDIVKIYFPNETKLSKYRILNGKMELPNEGIEVKFSLNETFDMELNKIFKNYLDIKDLNQLNKKSLMDFDLFIYYDERKTDFDINFKTKESKIKFFDRVLNIEDIDLNYKNKGLKLKLIGKDEETGVELKVEETIDLNKTSHKGKLFVKDFGSLIPLVKCFNFDAFFQTEDKNIVVEKINGKCSYKDNMTLFENNSFSFDVVEQILKSNGKIKNKDMYFKYDLKHKINTEIIEGRLFVENLQNDYEKITDLKNKEFKFRFNITTKEIDFFEYGIKLNLIDKKLNIKDINVINSFFTKDLFKSDNLGIQIEQVGNRIEIKGEKIEINLDNLKTIIEKVKENKKTKKQLLHIDLNNSILKYKNRIINFNNIDILVDDVRTNTMLKKGNSTIRYTIFDAGEEEIEGNKITSDLLNEIMQITNFEKGSTNFYFRKNRFKDKFKGYIKQKNVLVKDSLVIANIGRVLNITPMLINPWLLIPSIPSMLQNTNVEAYLIEKGEAKVKINEDFTIFNITDFTTSNPINNFAGKMLINFENGKINGDIKIRFLKTYSKIVEIIPVIGKILVGEDGLISSKVKVEGTVKEPKITVIPFNLSLNFKEGEYKEEDEFDISGDVLDIF